MADDVPLSVAARSALTAAWDAAASDATPDLSDVSEEVSEAIRLSVNSKTKTYRYVLPTHLAAKAANPSLDCRSVQANCGLIEAFDARSVCDDVVVPFDRDNQNVLGGSGEPYANNPLRIPAILSAARAAQRDKDGFDKLRLVLDYCQDQPEKAQQLLRIVMSHVYRRLAEVAFVYAVPNRVSLVHCRGVLAAFLSARTGGIRLQSVAVALFRTIGLRFGLFADVTSHNVNAADASTGSAADLECIAADQTVVMAVEVKDRQLVIRHVQDKLPAIRAKGIDELIFLVQNGVTATDADAVNELIAQQFATGQNIYVCEFKSFISAILVLFGGEGRRQFLKAIGEELDERKADLKHRQAWRDLLGAI